MQASKPMQLPEEQHRSLSDQVADKLQTAIIEGRFVLGENVSEERLATAFGVSRTPVRDALNALQFTGLVEVRPKRGSFVFNPTAQDILELWEFREIVEREACGLAMAKHPQNMICDLRAVVELMLPNETDSQKYAKLDARFHQCFFQHCGNPHIRAAHGLVAARIATIIALIARDSQGRRRGSVLEHQWMLKCLETGDLREFNSIHRAHMTRTLDMAHDHFSAS